jgi:hypothetical protein
MAAILDANDCVWVEQRGLIRVRAAETRVFSVDYIRLARTGQGSSSAMLSSSQGSSSGGSGGGSSGGGGGSMGGGGRRQLRRRRHGRRRQRRWERLDGDAHGRQHH